MRLISPVTTMSRQAEPQDEVSHPHSDPDPPAHHTLSIFISHQLPPGSDLHPSSHHVWILHHFLGLCVVTFYLLKNFEN